MKSVIRTSETPRRRSTPLGNERRLATQHPRRRILTLAAGAAALLRVARAQAYPARPVRIIVGYAAGGGTDIAARLMGRWLLERVGQPFIIQNRTGFSGNIATEAVVRAAPDGYTLLADVDSNAFNATLYDKPNFNYIRDIVPVAGIIRFPFVMVAVVNPSFPAKTVPEFIAYAKANLGKINMASAGIGSGPHLCGELFKIMAGVNMIHVPYRGSAPALADLLGGRVQVTFADMLSSLEYIKAGKLRALAVTTAVRSEALPGIPTVGEYVPGYEASDRCAKEYACRDDRHTKQRDQRWPRRSYATEEAGRSGWDPKRRFACRLPQVHCRRSRQSIGKCRKSVKCRRNCLYDTTLLVSRRQAAGRHALHRTNRRCRTSQLRPASLTHKTDRP
jgi:tripartite-type tricarboxylate transporter receptor subunit TctC